MTLLRRLLGLLLVLSALPPLSAQTVLVLPFRNQSNSSNLDWIGESICEALRESLVSEGVLAPDREDRLEAFRQLSLRPSAVLTVASMIKTGEALDASQLVYGQYKVTPGDANASAASHRTLRIAAHILNLRRFQQGPELTESGALDDLATLEARLSWQALEALSPQRAPSENEFLKSRPPVRLDALESYIRGLMVEDPDQQRRFFLRAARLDQGYSQPCFQLGKSYWEKKDYRSAANWLARVNRADPHYLEARFYLGLCDYHLGDYTAAAQSFEIVAASVPLNEVYNDLGAAQAHSDPQSAAKSFRKAIEGDNSDPDYHFNLGCVLWRAGQYAAAADSFRTALAANPKDQEAAALLNRSEHRQPPRPEVEPHERLKTSYQETAYRQLKAELQPKKSK